jgi:hypothetical protein
VFLPSRSARGSDPLYRWKALALVTGIGLFLAGVRFEIPLLNWAGIGALGVALVLRVFRGTGGTGGTEGTEGTDLRGR